MDSNFKNEAGEIHYLKKPRQKKPKLYPVDSTNDQLVHRLEARLDRMEKEFSEAIKTFGQNDLSSLAKRLEEKIQLVSDEISVQTKKREKKNISDTLMKISQKLNQSHLSYILHDLWFGRPDGVPEVDEFGMDPVFSQKVKPLFDFLYYKYWRVAVKGIQNIPNEGRGLIVPNHSGTLPYDGAMIREATENEHPSRRDCRFLVEDFVYHFPFMGTFMYRIGGVRACPENAERLLSKNHLVTVFPEGAKGIGKNYRNRYRLQRFGRGGFIKIALKTKSPIIPTAVIGAEEIHPLLYKSTALARPLGIPYVPVTPTLPALGLFGLIPLPSKWKIVFGEPIDFSQKHSPNDANDQLLVNQLSEQVREKIQAMIVEELKHRRSVWFG